MLQCEKYLYFHLLIHWSLTEFAPIKSAVIVPLGICVAVTEFCANSLDVIEFSAICPAVTEFNANSDVVIVLAAILADVTAPVEICIVSILPDTSSLESTSLLL